MMDYPNKYDLNLSDGLAKTNWQKSLHLGFCTLMFGSFTEDRSEGKSRTLMLKVAGRPPKIKSERGTVFTFGLKTIRHGQSIKMGWIRRKQIIEKA